VPPHSRGGARQTYTLHLYALSTLPNFDDPAPVPREQLLTAIEAAIVDSADLAVTHQRPRDDQRGDGRGGDNKGRE
jgi:hypothetical protein